MYFFTSTMTWCILMIAFIRTWVCISSLLPWRGVYRWSRSWERRFVFLHFYHAVVYIDDRVHQNVGLYFFTSTMTWCILMIAFIRLWVCISSLLPWYGVYWWSRSSERGFVFLHFYHDMVYIDELIANLQLSEGSLVEDLLEAVIILDQLRQRSLHTQQQRQGQCTYTNITKFNV